MGGRGRVRHRGEGGWRRTRLQALISASLSRFLSGDYHMSFINHSRDFFGSDILTLVFVGLLLFSTFRRVFFTFNALSFYLFVLFMNTFVPIVIFPLFFFFFHVCDAVHVYRVELAHQVCARIRTTDILSVTRPCTKSLVYHGSCLSYYTSL